MLTHLQLPVRWRSYGTEEDSPFAPCLFAVLFNLVWPPSPRLDRRQPTTRAVRLEEVTNG